MLPFAVCLLMVTQGACLLNAQQWQAIDLPKKASLRAVAAGADGDLYVCGTIPQAAPEPARGVVFFSPDDGKLGSIGVRQQQTPSITARWRLLTSQHWW